MYTYDTVTAAIKGLRERGFTKDFNLDEDCLLCEQAKYHPKDFDIVEVYRFEGDSDPADEAIVYAIEGRGGQRGVLVNGYGTSAEQLGSDLAKKLAIHTHQ